MPRTSRIHDQHLLDDILNAIRLGVPPASAAVSYGLSETTYYRWMADANQPDPGTTATATERKAWAALEPYRVFRDRVHVCAREAERTAVVQLRRLMQGGQVVERVTTTRTDKRGLEVTETRERFTTPNASAVMYFLDRRADGWRPKAPAVTGQDVPGPDGHAVTIDYAAAEAEIDALIDRLTQTPASPPGA